MSATLLDLRPPGSSDKALGRAAAIGALSFVTVHDRLVPERRQLAVQLLQSLLVTPRDRGIADVVSALCESVAAAGVPLDRYSSSTAMVTADHDAIGRTWWSDKRDVQVYTFVGDDEAAYDASPFKVAAETRQWFEMWLPDTPDERFGVVAEFKAAGLLHYICVPIWLSNGANGWLSFATRRPTGFSEQDLLLIAFIVPALTMRIDGRVGWMTLDKLLRTYVGDEPHQAILAGRAKRGQVTTITAAILVADLRDSTGHVARLGLDGAVELLNTLFDCLVPDIEKGRGEVLKYLGDGLLAIFREEYAGPPASERALMAAQAAFASIRRANADRSEQRPMEVGIALHYGEVAYGNIGSGSRLDFTVIGPDVALATRIAAMNGPLALPLLMSQDFTTRLGHEARCIGSFPARGFEQPLVVFEPEPADVVAVDLQ